MSMVDPRTSIIDERMKRIQRVIAVSGGKGGVGKSLIASTLALVLAEEGCKVGLLDLDFTSPSTHIILGAKNLKPTEEKGIVPPRVHGLRYMSITYYSGERALPLRGGDVSNALIELLSTTLWGELDYLILDMPPGIGDATLDLIRLMKNAEFLIVTTSSRLAFETIRKLSDLLGTLKVPVIGVLENMKTDRSRTVQVQVQRIGLTFLGRIPFDSAIEGTLGKPQELLETAVAKKVALIASRV
jgi:ATP-binding protein involved in chromosome partitioning